MTVLADCLFKEIFEEDTKARETILAKKVLEFISETDNGYSKKLKITDLAEVTGMKGKFILHGLTVKLRDIPFNLVDFNLIHCEMSNLNLRYVADNHQERVLSVEAPEERIRRHNSALQGQLHH
jgi:hypothetical protein